MNDYALTLMDLARRSGVELRTLRSWIQQGVVPGPQSIGRNARYAPETLTRILAVKAMRDVYGLSLAEIRRDLLAADEARIAAYAALASAPGSDPKTETLAAPARKEGGTLEETGAIGAAEAQPGAPAAPPPAPPPAGSSAANYLRGLRATGVFGGGPAGQRDAALPPPVRASAPSPLGGAHRPRVASADPFTRPDAEDAQSAAPPAATGGASTSKLVRLVETLERIAAPRSARRRARSEVRLHIPITPDLELTVRGEHSPEEIARFEQVADLVRTILTGGSEHD